MNPSTKLGGQERRPLYLGLRFRGIRIFASHQALKDFKHRIKGLTLRTWGVSMAERIERLHRSLRGWMNDYGISQHYSLIEELEGWLRLGPGTCIVSLLKFGTSRCHAILTGISRKVY